MDNGGPTPSYEGNAVSSKHPNAEKDKQGLHGLNPTTKEAEAVKKRSEIQFKAAHGLLVAFLTLIL